MHGSLGSGRRTRTGRLVLLALLLSPLAAWAEEPNPLEPIDTSSPRAVLDGFLADMDAAWATIYARTETSRPSRADIARVAYFADRVLRRLDLSDVAPTARLEEGYDSASYLYEVLNRLELPPLSEIPDANQRPPPTTPAEWRVPHTEIAIVRRSEGERAGEFLISRDTVARAKDFFQRVEHLPYQREVPVEHINTLRQIAPGWMISVPFIRSLPAPLLEIVLGQAVWKLIAFVLLLVLVLLLVIVLGRLMRPPESASPLRFYLSRLVAPAVLLAILPFAVYLTTEQINIVGDFAQAVRFGADIVAILAGTWVAWLGCLSLAELLIAAPRTRTNSLNAQLLRLTGRVAGIVLGLVVIFVGANRIGLPLLGVLAGVGVGGLAIALAAQDSLKNLLGSLMIFMDQPYKPGQRIVAEGQDGFVEQIGLRSTRIRQLGGSLVTIPNEKMARMDIENIGERTFMRRVANIRIPIDTSPAKTERALAILHEILDEHEGMRPELPPRIFFSEFNPDSLNLYVSYWFHPPRRWQFFAFNQQVNLAILRRFADDGIAFAVPTSTTRLIRDADGRPPDQRHAND